MIHSFTQFTPLLVKSNDLTHSATLAKFEDTKGQQKKHKIKKGTS
jgi:hypothetical protein